MTKKVLVLGGTGAMGSYLVPKLVEDGHKVDVVSLDKRESNHANLTYRQMNCKDPAVIRELMKDGYDAVVDFMIYNDLKLKDVAPLFLDNTDHYMYFSTYRVFADEEHPITERSPHLWHCSKDQDLLKSNDYSIYKSQGEDYLKQSGYKNWIIVRPAITYSVKRCQLITLERPQLLPYFESHQPINLYGEALKIEGTMSWAGDVAEMERRLLFNDKALCEDFNLSTSEHHKWGEIAEYYKDIFGLQYQECDEDTYLRNFGDYTILNIRQLRIDRMFNRIMDNTKVLTYTGMKQSEMMKLYDGLVHERPTILAKD